MKNENKMKITYTYNIRTGESVKQVYIRGKLWVPVYEIQPAASGCPVIKQGEGSSPSVATTRNIAGI